MLVFITKNERETGMAVSGAAWPAGVRRSGACGPPPLGVGRGQAVPAAFPLSHPSPPVLLLMGLTPQALP